MKRRDALRLMPLAAAATAVPGIVRAGDTTPFGLQYTAKVRALMERIRAESSDDMVEASWRMAEAVKRGDRKSVV